MHQLAGKVLSALNKFLNPVSAKDNADIETKTDSVITQKDYKKIEQFKSYLLQLRDDSINRKKFDSIMLLRTTSS